MAGEIKKILFEIGANLARLQGDMGKAQGIIDKSVSGIMSKFKGLGIGIGSALGVRGIGAFIKSAIDLGEEINKASQKFGIGAESISALKYAAELSDVAFEDLGVGLKKLSQEMAQGNKAFEHMGIQVKNASGGLRTTEDVLLDVADAFSRYKDGAAKTALAVELFGKQGANLIPLLNQGKAGIKDLMEEAQRLGVVIDTKTAKASEEFNDNLKRLKASASGVGISIANTVVPALNAMLEGILAVNQAWRDHKKAIVESGLDMIVPIEGIFAVPDISKIKRPVTGSEDIIGYAGYSGAGAGGKVEPPDLEAMKKAAEERKKMNEAILKMDADHYVKEGEIVHRSLAAEMGMSQDYYDTVREMREKDFKDWKQLQSDILELDLKHYEREGEIIHDALAAEMGFGMESLIEPVLEKDIQAIEEGRRALSLYAESWNYINETAKGYLLDIQDAFLDAFIGLEDVLTDFVMTGKAQFSDFARSVLADLARIAIKANITAPLAGVLSSIWPAFGGGKAEGGIVSPGTTYIVGERGPELFMPRYSGSIIPSNGSSKVTVNVQNYTNQNIEAKDVQTSFDPRGMIIDVVLDAVNRNVRGMRTALGRT